MLTLTLAVLLQMTPVQEQDAERILSKGISELTERVDEFENIITTRLEVHARKPQSGIQAESAETTGADGLHAVHVIAVMPNGPGDIVGVHVGDRIVAIGTRILEHETTDVVRILLDDVSGSVVLTLRSGTRERTVVVERAPLPCLEASLDAIDTGGWLNRISLYKKTTALLHEELVDTTVPSTVRYQATFDHFRDIVGSFQRDVRQFQWELDLVTKKMCVYTP